MNLKNQILRTTLLLATFSAAVAVSAVDAGGGVRATPATRNETQLAVAAVKAPTAPRSPTATPGNAYVKLSWRAPLNRGGAAIDKYLVQRSRTGASQWRTIGYTRRTALKATALKNGLRYYFRIRAHNAAGWGPSSIGVSAVPRTVPGAPTVLAATPGDANVRLTWTRPASHGATIGKYAVQRFDTASLQWKTIASPTTPSYMVGSLSNGTSYSFRVLAHNVAGWSPVSATVDAVPRTTPSAPQTCLASQPNGPGSHEMQVVWFPPVSDGGAPVLLYRVEIWYGPLLTDVHLWVPAVNKYNNNVNTVWISKLNDYWQAKVIALNEASTLVPVDQPQPGASCLAGTWMES
jgi:titin